MSQIELDDLPLLPRDSGAEWPSTRSWTDSERLELRELQLRQVLFQISEAQQWAVRLKRIAKDIWLEENAHADIDLIFDDDTMMPEWLHDPLPIAPLEAADAP